MNKLRIGFAMCGSFCTFERALTSLSALLSMGVEAVPIMSGNAASTDTRFGPAGFFKSRLRLLTGRDIITTIAEAEPIGPKNLCDVMVIAPCTGNTLAKLATSVTDTAVTMAAKSMLRNGKPVLVALSTNDGLSGSLKNIAALLNTKNYYFVPMRQDDPVGKPNSLVADYDLLPAALKATADGKQLRPLFV